MADRLGFDAIVVNEHHNTVYSMMATPNLIAAALVPQTKNARICVWGTPPNFMLPNRLAEEYAILDVMSKGRLEIALPLGTGMEYWSNPVNPATAREKFKESVKIMLQAWTEDGPTTHYGSFYTYRFLNPWPRPYQKPHPPCYVVGTGSPETIEIAAELGFGYASVFVTQQRARELNETLRQRAAHYGHTLRPDQLPLLTFVYVAETQERAEQEYIVHLQRFFEDYARTSPQFLAPPGYLSRTS
jgi:alkanesulfonate monooxygenase SsuD/methylene tetrahydromethanopterin reductase-like flavin-dependent oxidoreductase (luciferase family)